MKDTQLMRESGSVLLSDAASPAHLRADLWNRLRQSVERAASRLPEVHRAEIEALFQRLEELERLWVYPGRERLDQMRRLHRSGDLVQLRALVNELVDQLSTLGDRAALAGEGVPAERGA